MAASTKQQRTAAAPAVDPYLAAAQAGIDSAPQEGKRGSYLKLPEGTQWANFARGQCFKVLNLAFTWGKKPQQGMQTGQLGTVLRLSVHKNIGPQEVTILCNQAMFGKKCAVCDEYNARKGGRSRLPDDEYKALSYLRAQNRTARIMHVIGGAPDNLVVFEEATLLYDDFFTGLIANREAYKMFAHPIKGYIIEITGREKSIGKGSCTEYATIVMTELGKRSGLEKMPASVVEKSKKIVFDDYLIPPPSYETVKSWVHGHVAQDSNGQSSASEEIHETPEPDASGDEIVEEPAEPTDEVVETTEPEPEPEEVEEPVEEEAEPEPEPEPALEVGSAVTFTYSGQTREGEITALDGDKAKVRSDKKIYTVKLDKLAPV